MNTDNREEPRPEEVERTSKASSQPLSDEDSRMAPAMTLEETAAKQRDAWALRTTMMNSRKALETQNLLQKQRRRRTRHQKADVREFQAQLLRQNDSTTRPQKKQLKKLKEAHKRAHRIEKAHGTETKALGKIVEREERQLFEALLEIQHLQNRQFDAELIGAPVAADAAAPVESCLRCLQQRRDAEHSNSSDYSKTFRRLDGPGHYKAPAIPPPVSLNNGPIKDMAAMKALQERAKLLRQVQIEKFVLSLEWEAELWYLEHRLRRLHQTYRKQQELFKRSNPYSTDEALEILFEPVYNKRRELLLVRLRAAKEEQGKARRFRNEVESSQNDDWHVPLEVHALEMVASFEEPDVSETSRTRLENAYDPVPIGKTQPGPVLEQRALRLSKQQEMGASAEGDSYARPGNDSPPEVSKDKQTNSLKVTEAMKRSQRLYTAYWKLSGRAQKHAKTVKEQKEHYLRTHPNATNDSVLDAFETIYEGRRKYFAESERNALVAFEVHCEEEGLDIEEETHRLWTLWENENFDTQRQRSERFAATQEVVRSRESEQQRLIGELRKHRDDSDKERERYCRTNTYMTKENAEKYFKEIYDSRGKVKTKEYDAVGVKLKRARLALETGRRDLMAALILPLESRAVEAVNKHSAQYRSGASQDQHDSEEEALKTLEVWETLVKTTKASLKLHQSNYAKMLQELVDNNPWVGIDFLKEVFAPIFLRRGEKIVGALNLAKTLLKHCRISAKNAGVLNSNTHDERASQSEYLSCAEDGRLIAEEDRLQIEACDRDRIYAWLERDHMQIDPEDEPTDRQRWSAEVTVNTWDSISCKDRNIRRRRLDEVEKARVSKRRRFEDIGVFPDDPEEERDVKRPRSF
ncbi:hypothetical protein NX059_011366 [Plenodomus lindquistii]|nr:hypothetical protein NX059_011366 [Plenodomus lindquistii]